MKINIYKITNKVNGKLYIGQTRQTVERRWTRHKRDALGTLDTYFCRAINKYGPENFIVERIAVADGQVWANYLETLYIKIYRTFNSSFGYNRSPGGHSGVIHPEDRAKIGASSRKWWENPENKRRASESRKGLLVGERNPMFGRHDLGQPHTEETKQLISDLAKKRFENPEYKKMMSEANKGKHHTAEGRANISKGSTGNHKLGTTQTAETRAKISASLKRMNAAKSAAKINVIGRSPK